MRTFDESLVRSLVKSTSKSLLPLLEVDRIADLGANMAGLTPANLETPMTTHRGASMGVLCPTGWCETPQGRVAWQAIGPPLISAQPIVCLHDVASGSRDYRPVKSSVPIGSRLILIDWPRHGRSEGDASASAEAAAESVISIESMSAGLELILSRLGLSSVKNDSRKQGGSGYKRPILLASGFGAAVALDYAHRHPGLVLALVLCQPAGLISPQRQSRGLFQSAASTPSRRQALRVESLSSKMPAVKRQAYASLENSQAALRASLIDLSCPVFFALSQDAEIFPLKRYLALLNPLLRASPHYSLTVFSGGFHPLWDEPGRFAQALNAFVQAQLPLEEHHHAWLLTSVDFPARDSNLWKCAHPLCAADKILGEGQNPNDYCE